MNAQELRELQAPLKQKYRDNPDAGEVRAYAEGRLGAGITCSVSGWGEDTLAGLHPATGGDGSKACSADMLLEALVACAGVTLNSVATHMGISLKDAAVRAEGRWDAGGTLGVYRDAPVGLTDIELSTDISLVHGPLRCTLLA